MHTSTKPLKLIEIDVIFLLKSFIYEDLIRQKRKAEKMENCGGLIDMKINVFIFKFSLTIMALLIIY